MVKGVHPIVDQQFGYAAPLLDLAGIRTTDIYSMSVIRTELSGAITTQFCFSYSLGGVTAMPRIKYR